LSGRRGCRNGHPPNALTKQIASQRVDDREYESPQQHEEPDAQDKER
jgi:hypothetical protein